MSIRNLTSVAITEMAAAIPEINCPLRTARLWVGRTGLPARLSAGNDVELILEKSVNEGTDAGGRSEDHKHGEQHEHRHHRD